MAVEAINNPIFEYTCDLCGTQERAKWIPPNWEAISVALGGGGLGQFHLCQECIMTSNIVVLLNRAKTNVAVNEQ